MKDRAGGVLFLIALLTASSAAIAQQPTPLPPSQSAPASLGVPNPLAGNPPVALTVPNPLSADLGQYSPGRSHYFPYGPYYFPYGPYYPYEAYYFRYPLYGPYLVFGYHWQMPQAQFGNGALVLEALPDQAQVFVNGYYAGVAEDYGLRGKPLDLVAGTHRVELRAPGYELLSFSVVIEPNEILRYRGDMQLLTPTQLSRPIVIQTSAPKGVYVIPSCYAGNKPPSGNLPAGCDAKKVESRK